MAIILDKELKVIKELDKISFNNKLDKNKLFVKIGVLNLMPTLEDTERQLIKMLDNPAVQVKLDFIYLESKSNKDYVKKYYKSFNSIKEEDYDGFIVTGAPLEHLNYNDVSYIEELKEVFKFIKEHVLSSLFLCWAAEFGLQYFYGVNRYNLINKLSGLYEHYLVTKSDLVKGFDDNFYIPISRYCSIIESDIAKRKDLIITSKSNESGIFIIESKDGKRVFVTGHVEYERDTLEKEYLRDLSGGLDTKIPVNYYKDDDIRNKPSLSWQAHGTLLYQNWLFYYVLKKKYS